MKPRGSLASRVLGAQALSLVAFAGVLIGSMVAMRGASREMELVSAGTVPLARIMARVSSVQFREYDAARLTQEPRTLAIYKDGIERSRRRVQDGLDEADKLLSQLAVEATGNSTTFAYRSLRRELDLVQASWERFSEAELETLSATENHLTELALKEPGAELENSERRYRLLLSRQRNLIAYQREFEKHTSSMTSVLDRRLAGAVGRARALQSRSMVWLAAMGIFAALLSGLSLWWVSRSLAPLSELLAQVEDLAAGRYTQLRPVTGGGELASLSAELQATAAALAEREERLRRAERLAGVGEVAAQITHEIRNPLNALAMNIDLLAEDPNASEAGELWTSVREEIDRLANITETYLQLARLPSGEHGPVPLAELLDELSTLLGAEIARQGIVLTRSWPAGALEVHGDTEQLRRALMNLLQNSIAAMSQGGRLDLSARQIDDQVELKIQDTGSGIEAEDLPRIFDPFFSKRDGGTGLGLAIADRIVADHGGSLRLSSTPGQGTTAILRIPSVPAQDGPAQERS